MDQRIAINLDQPISQDWLAPHLGFAGAAECDDRAQVMTIREALKTAAAVLERAGPVDLDVAAFGPPGKLAQAIERNAATMVLEALAASG